MFVSTRLESSALRIKREHLLVLRSKPRVMSVDFVILAPKGQQSNWATCCGVSCTEGTKVVFALQLHGSAASLVNNKAP